MNFLVTSGLLALCAADPCLLLGGMESSKPQPSLWKCYRYNKDACCVSTHDHMIDLEYQLFLSSSCQRTFSDLEAYFCTGCNPILSTSADKISRTLTLCRGFAESVWGGKLEFPSSSFDQCGLNTYWRGNSTTVMQSKEWPNAYAFFAEVKPPYFQDYRIVIVSNDQPCFGAGKKLIVLLGLAFLY